MILKLDQFLHVMITHTHTYIHTNALFPSAVVLCVYFQVSFETKLKDNYKLELVNVLHEHALLMTATR